MKMKSQSEVTQSCLTLSDPMGCSPPGSSVRGILKDSFYYELFHELGHCKSDYNEAQKKVIFEGSVEQEKRADEFALETMIPKSIWKEIEKDFSEENIDKISETYKIPLSFIVGRMANLNIIKYNSKLYNKNKLK